MLDCVSNFRGFNYLSLTVKTLCSRFVARHVAEQDMRATFGKELGKGNSPAFESIATDAEQTGIKF
jgi:hypothetical protein